MDEAYSFWRFRGNAFRVCMGIAKSAIVIVVAGEALSAYLAKVLSANWVNKPHIIWETDLPSGHYIRQVFLSILIPNIP